MGGFASSMINRNLQNDHLLLSDIAFEIATAHWKSKALNTFVALKIPDVMYAEHNEFVSPDTVATNCGIHPVATFRLLRYLATIGLVVQSDDGCFKLTKLGDICRRDHEASVAKKVLLESCNEHRIGWNYFGDFMKTNERIAEKAYGCDYWELCSRNPNHLQEFQEAMSAYSALLAQTLLSSKRSPTLDMSQFSIICDLGCAEGALAEVLNQRFSVETWILADLPEVVERIDMSKKPGNFQKQKCDFLKQVPIADAYVMKHIIHDWPNDLCGKILENIKKANPRARVFVIEFGPMPGPNIPHITKAFDLLMGVLLGAHERTPTEYEQLFNTNNFKLVQTHIFDGGLNSYHCLEIMYAEHLIP